ncbi:MAG: DUF4363 family protein [Clostridia bacterium]|nr:DUF4363 family protein [Clostridia bacterium]
MLNIRFVVALLLVFAAFVVSIFGGWMTKKIALQLLDMTTLVATAAKSSQPVASAQILLSYWNECHQLLSVFLDNSRCEQIGNLVIQIYSEAGQEETDTCGAVCVQLMQQLNDVIRQEKISIYNLF